MLETGLNVSASTYKSSSLVLQTALQMLTDPRILGLVDLTAEVRKALFAMLYDSFEVDNLESQRVELSSGLWDGNFRANVVGHDEFVLRSAFEAFWFSFSSEMFRGQVKDSRAKEQSSCFSAAELVTMEGRGLSESV